MPGERSRPIIMLSAPPETGLRPHSIRPGVANVTDAIVLCYHALSPTWEADLSTTPQRFEQQLTLLAERGYRGATFSEVVAAKGREKVLAVTFDDAYLSVLKLAKPILDRLGFPASVFAPTDGVDAGGVLSWPGIDQWLGGPHEHELTPMSWEQLRALAVGGWEIGSHTATHPHLTQLDDARLRDELTRSRAACEERLGAACTTLAYPYGDVDARVVAAAASAGYETAAALPKRLSSCDPLDWPRIGVYFADDDRRFRLKVSPVARRLRRSRLWSSLERMRGIAARRRS
jgi:peptidoglycan/xylan/chitin deacetylase (PgdA/CDA1 family)